MDDAFKTRTASPDSPPFSDFAASAQAGPTAAVVKYLSRPGAAEYLTEVLGRPVTVTALDKHASDETGPKYVIILGRASYHPEWLDSWVDRLVKPPASRRRSVLHGRINSRGVRAIEQKTDTASSNNITTADTSTSSDRDDKSCCTKQPAAKPAKKVSDQLQIRLRGTESSETLELRSATPEKSA